MYALLSSDLSPTNTCTGISEVIQLDQASTGPAADDVPINDCSFEVNSMAISPDGIVLLGGSGTGPGQSGHDDTLLKYSLSRSLTYSVDLNSMTSTGLNSPYANYSPTVDDNGTVVIISTADDPASWPTDRYLVVRKFDSTTGSATVLYKSSDDRTLNSGTSDRFGTASDAIDIEDGVVFFLTCYSNYGYTCFGTSSAAVSKVSDSGLGSEYPRSELNFSDDYDGDGLSMSGERVQATSDRKTDYDNDGLSDFVESIYFTTRNQTFCKMTNNTPTSCTYPDPLEKDIYVEIDWLYDIESAYSTQPSPNQLSKIGEAFATRDIKLHFDIGAYDGDDDDAVNSEVAIGDYGGGNKAPYDAGILADKNTYSGDGNYNDLIDYKMGNYSQNIPPQFKFSERSNIWRYFLSAREIPDPEWTVLGATTVGNDESIIAYSTTAAESQGENEFVQRLPKLIAHELGHQLCLGTGSTAPPYTYYSEQSGNCVFDKIDTDNNREDYQSIMHYTILNNMIYVNGVRQSYPLPTYSYSSGLGVNGDHDDWLGILGGVGDFSKQKTYVYLIPPTAAICRLECN